MPEISMTDFVDFVVKVGAPKLTKVRQVKYRTGYTPAIDYWGLLRKGIIDFHKEGCKDKGKLEKIPRTTLNQSKKALYPIVLKGYTKFLGRKNTKWFSPPQRKVWSKGGLDVRINPELGLKINNERHIIKLYFKKDALTKQKTKSILALLEDSIRASTTSECKLCVLDVRFGNLFDSQGGMENLYPLLYGEAASFVEMWNMI